MKALSLGTRRSPQVIAAALIAGGSLLLAWTGYETFGPQRDGLPYKRVLVDEGAVEKFPALGLETSKSVNIRKYEIRTQGVDKPLAEFHVAQSGTSAPVPLSWQNNLAEPVLLSNAEAAAAKTVADAIAKHLPANAVVFAWWDTSRRLKLFKNIPVAFSDAGPGPLFIPAVWNAYSKTIRAKERTFWESAEAPAASSPAFEKFTDTLLMDVHAGTAKLREMSEGRPIFIALNLLDAYKAGHVSPEKFGIGFRDFAKSSQSHGLIKGVKAWIKEKGHTAYSVYSVGDTVTRVYFLTDEPSKHTLLASLLPFNTSKPGQIPGAKLVYQHRGYWIYELSPTKHAGK